ncbi:hypothetical protein AMK16_15775 [Streptomyces sp. CB00455]|nr:hypothetical protein AMK16_15775 [Streptomyces sp. CB00455]
MTPPGAGGPTAVPVVTVRPRRRTIVPAAATAWSRRPADGATAVPVAVVVWSRRPLVCRIPMVCRLPRRRW